MNMHDDAVRALRGETPGRIPFVARMDLWYNTQRSLGTLPAPYRNASVFEFARDLGISVLAFGSFAPPVCRLAYTGGSEVRSWWEGQERIDEYVTPRGTMRARYRLPDELQPGDMSPACFEYPFHGPQDYDVLEYLFEHTRVEENHDEYARYLAGAGEAGFALPLSGMVPMHALMKDYIGYNQFYFELYDHLPQLERVAQAYERVHLEIIDVAARSAADVVEVGGNYDQMMTPPPIFRTYFLPFYRQAVPRLHAAGKVVALHGDGDMAPELLKLMVETGVDAVEALTPRPMTSIDVGEARRLWGDQLTLWGGIPAILMTDTYTDEDLADFLAGLFSAVAPGRRFVLGFGDNVPADGLYRRILQVVEFHREHCRL